MTRTRRGKRMQRSKGGEGEGEDKPAGSGGKACCDRRTRRGQVRTKGGEALGAILVFGNGAQEGLDGAFGKVDPLAVVGGVHHED